MVGAMKRIDVVTLGESMALVRPTDGSPVAAAGRFVMSVAGTESNVAVALARLGHRVAFTGRVGDDAAGSRVRRQLKADGVDVANLRVDPTFPTGILVRDVGGRRGISVDYHRYGSAGSSLCPDDVDTSEIGAARILFVTGLTCGLSDSAFAAVEHAIGSAKDAGTTVWMDPNIRTKLLPLSDWEPRLRPLLDKVDAIIGSDEELQLVTRTAETGAAVAALRDLGIGTVVVRAGTAATRGFRGTDTVEVRVDPVEAVDPVGAGDAFSGGLLSGLLDDLSLESALVRAQQVARRCVLTVGDVEGLPTRRELARDENEVTR